MHYLVYFFRDDFIFVYLPLVKKEVDDYCVDWNYHKIRTQRAVTLPTGGAPEDFYNFPEDFGEITLKL